MGIAHNKINLCVYFIIYILNVCVFIYTVFLLCYDGTNCMLSAPAPSLARTCIYFYYRRIKYYSHSTPKRRTIAIAVKSIVQYRELCRKGERKRETHTHTHRESERENCRSELDYKIIFISLLSCIFQDNFKYTSMRNIFCAQIWKYFAAISKLYASLCVKKK